LVALAAVAALAVAGCSSGKKSSTSGPIVLGMAVPLSGSSAAIGPYMKNGAQMAVDEINAKGGVGGRQLVLKAEDDACDPRTATAAANKLVTEGVQISVGGYCSSATLPTLAVFHRKGIPMLIPAANSNDLVNQHLDNVFMLNGTGTQQSAAAVAFMKKQGATKVSLVDDNTSYSKNITDLVAKALAGGAPALAGRQSVTAGESDYSAAVKAVMDQHPDFVYWTGYYQEGGLLIRQLHQAGYTGKVMVADGSVDAKLVSIAGGDNAEGVYATMTMTPQTIPGDEQWVTSYKAKFGADPGPYSTQCYDAVRVAAEAVKDAGSTDGGKVTKALEAINGFQIFSGPLTFTAEHTLSTGGFQILVVKSGQFALQDANPA